MKLHRKQKKLLADQIQRFQKKYPSAADEERADYADSLIKHFELAYGSIWKFLKFYRLGKHGIEVIDSKDVFKAFYDLKLLDDQRLKVLLGAVELRNFSTISRTLKINNEIAAGVMP